MAPDISSSRVKELKAEIERRRRLVTEVLERAPFLVIKPSGLNFRREIHEELDREGLAVGEERMIADWNRSAAAIYCDPLTDAGLLRSLILAEALPDLEGGTQALMLVLRHDASVEALQRVKRSLRERLQPQHVLIRHEDDLIVTTLNHVHVPDPERWEIEYALLVATEA